MLRSFEIILLYKVIISCLLNLLADVNTICGDVKNFMLLQAFSDKFCTNRTFKDLEC